MWHIPHRFQNRLIHAGALTFMLALAATAWAAPFADRVSPQRLTLFVGQGEQRVRIEGSDLDQVDDVVAYDTSSTGRNVELPEVRARIVNAEDGVLTVILRADQRPAGGRQVQLALMFGHQGYLIPANVFQMEIR